MMSEDQAFCDKCGNKAGAVPSQERNMYIREKSDGIAAVLSFLWAGAGQIYVGRIKRGLGILLAYTLVSIVAYALIFSILMLGAGLTEAGIVLLFCVTIGMFAIWIWNIFDAYKLAKEYNSYVAANGKRPW